MLDSALRSPADAALLVLDYPGEETGERPQCDLLLQRYCAALKRHGKVGFASAFPELLPARACASCCTARASPRCRASRMVSAAWGRIARYRQRRAALLERGEAALVPICPGPLAATATCSTSGNPSRR